MSENGGRDEAFQRRRPGPRGLVPVAVAVALAGALVGGCGSHGATADAPSMQSPTASTHQSGAAKDATASGESDVSMPVGDIPGWHQIFTDDFHGEDVPVGGFSGCSNEATRVCTGLPSSVQSKWWAYPDGWSDTTHKGVYSPSTTISITNDEMHLHMYTGNGVHYVAAPVPKLPNPTGKEGGQLYGRYAIRFMVKQPTPGFKIAWLLWPDSENFPTDGEIDFPEGMLSGPISAYMHRQNGDSGHDQDTYNTDIAVSSGWHTAVTEWTASACRFILDGKAIGTSTSRIPHTPMHWVIQSETWGGAPGASAVADIDIAWVAIYQPA